MSNELMNDDDVASVVSLRELAETSEIDIPDVQRGLVWNPTQIVELWKSIFDGYPIGALTVYKQGDKWQLIDGQQRWHAIKLGLKPDEEHNAMSILWTVWEKKHDEWDFYLMVSTRRHPWGFAWNKNGDRLERLSHGKMVEVWEKMLPPNERKVPFKLPTLEEAQHFLRNGSTPKWIPLHELLAEKVTTDDADVLSIWESAKVTTWREYVRNRSIPLIRFNLQGNAEAGKNRIHELFTRINKGGTQISNVDYTYSTLCSYLGKQFKARINSIAKDFMPPNRVARLYARLKYAEKNETANLLHEPPHYSHWSGREYDDEISKVIEAAKALYTSINIPQTVYLNATGDEWLTVVIWCIQRFPFVLRGSLPHQKLLCILPYVVCRDPGYHTCFCNYFVEALRDVQPLNLTELLAIGVAYASCYSIKTGMYPISEPHQPTIKREYPYDDEWLSVLCNPGNEPLLHFLQGSYMNMMLRSECGFFPHETATWGEAMNRPWDVDHMVPRSKWWCYEKQEEELFRESLANKQLLYYRRNREKNNHFVGVPSDDGICPVQDFCYPEKEISEDHSYYGIQGVQAWNNRPSHLFEQTKSANRKVYSTYLNGYKEAVNARFEKMVDLLWTELDLESLIQEINRLPQSISKPPCLKLPLELWHYLTERKDLTWCSVRHDLSRQQPIEIKDFYHSLCEWLAVGTVKSGAFICVCWHLHDKDAKTLDVEAGHRRLPDKTVEEWRDGATPDAPRNDWWVDDTSFCALSCGPADNPISRIEELDHKIFSSHKY